MLNPENSALQSPKRNVGGVEFYLPDEIAVEILSRVSAKNVFRFRSVCKRWRDLTCSQNFTLLHMQRCLPMLIYEESEVPCDKYLLDQWWEPPPTKPNSYKFRNFSEFEVLFSNDGLVVMRNFFSQVYKIFNPICHENVQITLSEEFLGGEIYGVFFHPSRKEYCTLWRVPASREFTTEREEYRILNLGCTPCWRVISNPWSKKKRICQIPSILIDEHLYWAVDPEPNPRSSFPVGLMEFDIRKEEFTFIPSPVLKALECNKVNLSLLDIGGLLSWVWISSSGKQVDVRILTLKDSATRLWTRSSYSVNMDAYLWDRKPISLVNDELIFNSSQGLFICNLKLCTKRKFENHHKPAAFVTSHLLRPASLRNCTSNIYIDKFGEVEKNRKRRRWDM